MKSKSKDGKSMARKAPADGVAKAGVDARLACIESRILSIDRAMERIERIHIEAAANYGVANVVVSKLNDLSRVVARTEKVVAKVEAHAGALASMNTMEDGSVDAVSAVGVLSRLRRETLKALEEMRQIAGALGIRG